MKHTLLTLLLAASTPLLAADKPAPHPDPFAGAFFPPELVMLARDQIGMTQEQQVAFRDRGEKLRPRFDELRGRLERETVALAALAKKERVEEAAIIAQLDKVLDAERELKHLQIGLLVTIKNLLTPEQQAKLHQIAKDGGAKDSGAKLADQMRKRLTDKVTLVQAGMQKWAASGRDPSAIGQAMEEKFKPLIEAGKVIEAAAVLDRLLQQLNPDAK